MEIVANDRIRIGLKISEQMPGAKLITSASKVSPETLRDLLAVELLRQCRERLLPLRQGSRTVALLVVSNGQLVVYVRKVGRQFESVLVLGDRVPGVARTGIVIGESTGIRKRSPDSLQELQEGNRQDCRVWTSQDIRHSAIRSNTRCCRRVVVRDQPAWRGAHQWERRPARRGKHC